MRRLKTAFVLCSVFLACLTVGAQVDRTELRAHPDLATGNYCNYPQPVGNLTPAPSGYEPFYITHYGRHGARYMTNDRPYRYIIPKLDTASMMGILSPFGEDVLRRLRIAEENARGRAGDLTDLGRKQHRAIAFRMYRNFPSLLGDKVEVVANSSTTRRVMLSMASFCAELRGLNPSLSVKMDASQHDMYYILPNDSIVVPESVRDGQLYDELDVFKRRLLSGDHQFETLFTDPDRARSFIDGYTLADGLWNIASDMKCLPELHLSFDDAFTLDGLIDGHRVYNASWCLWEGLMPGARKSYYRIFPLLENILSEAEKMVESGGKGVRLRFGHDSVLLPLAYVLGVKEALGGTDDMENLHLSFSLFRLVPMAGNVQIVFYRKEGSDDVLVKFLMNECETSVPVATDMYPYYHWKDVDKYYRDMLRNANIEYKED
ncbi:MAG: histidine-type phosphatase [Bacteroidales bacterium]|nr:histidine-type phosphatase [Bacteroidales bacterium]